MSRQIGRRRMLQGGLGLAALASASLLTGCTQTQPGDSANVKSFDWHNYQGQTLNILMSEHPLSAALKANLGDFESKTGIKASIQTLNESDYMVKILTELQSKSGNYDVFMTSQPMNYQYAAAGWIEDLQPYVDNDKLTAPEYDFKDFFPALIDSLRWDKTDFGGAGKGGLWAIPANEEGYALFYRKDILQANGIAVPQTIDQLIAAAKKLNGTQFEGKTISGFVSRGDKTYPTLNPFSTFVKAYGVKDFTDGKPTINSPEGIEAASKWVELMKNAPQAASTYTWYEAQQDFLAGNSAFYIDADHMAPDFEKASSGIHGKVGYALPPEGPKGRGSGMWVWSLSMNAASDHKGAAWTFVQWATSKDLLTKALANGNMNPTRVSVADGKDMANATATWGDYNTEWKKTLSEYASWPYAPSATWTQAGDIWATALQSAVIGRQSVPDALNDAANKISAAIK